MQTPSSNPKKNSARRRSADPHARLSARLRHISFDAAVLLVVIAALTVIYSLYKIQIRDGATYRQYAAEQQLLDSTIQATRGEIYDTSGITLASTSVVWTIWADPSYSTALYTTTTDQDTKAETRTIDEAAMKEVCTQITLRLLSGDGESLDSVDTTSAEYQAQYQAVCDALSQNESSYQVLATKVNNAIKLSIEEYVKTYNKAHSKSGKSAGALEKILAKLGLGQQESDDGTPTVRKGRVSVSASKGFQRDYPYGRFAAAVLGFCNADGQGVYGLENSYESTLAGVNGRTITLRNAYGNAIADENATTYAAKDGSNLVLSLDVNIQEVVERYLNEAVAANTVENRGCAIVMNVKTGAILAMASKPDFDPNDPLDYSANLDYLNELVRAEPELYGIYKKDENGNVVKQGFDYYLKPMNCPMHNLIFKSRQRSYRELPLRLFEFGTVYRYEKSGEVHGLTRVRGLTQDDSHIYCTREQMKDELKNLLTFVLGLLKDFGLDDFYLELSTKDPHKYVGSDEIWEEATRTLREVAEASHLDLVADPGGAAFYGPKISVQARDAIGRTWQVSTIQLDFNLPERFQLEYIAKDGTHQRPVMIHRALFGSIERFFAVLLEHYAGAFPAWLAPVQVLGVPVADEFAPHLAGFVKSLEDEMVRCEIDYSDDRFGKKIRNASKSKVPFILIVGEEDMNNNAVSFRFRDGSQLNGVPVDEAREKILAVIKKRAQVNSADDFAAALA